MKFDNRLVFVILIIGLLGIGAYLYVNSVDSGEKRTITVQGMSEGKTKPDFMSIYFSVDTLKSKSTESQTENTAITSKVLNALEDFGFTKEEIETISFNVIEEYDYTQSGRNFKGYRATHYLKLELKEFDKSGNIIDAIISNGALINSIQFEVTTDTENALQIQLLEKASKDARAKAEAIAKGTGGKLGKIIFISPGDYYAVPIYAYENAQGTVRDSSEAKLAASQINAKELDITVTIQVSYEIK